jgi:hypothetical protein
MVVREERASKHHATSQPKFLQKSYPVAGVTSPSPGGARHAKLQSCFAVRVERHKSGPIRAKLANVRLVKKFEGFWPRNSHDWLEPQLFVVNHLNPLAPQT